MVTTSTEVFPLPKVEGSITVPPPIFTGVAKDVHLPLRTDTLYVDTGRVVVQVVDTAQIIQNYLEENRYVFNVFDNQSEGRLDVSLSVAQNNLTKFDYAYTGFKTVETRELVKSFKIFASIEYNTLGYGGLGGGFIYDNWALEYKYNIKLLNQNFDYLYKNYHSFGVKYIF